MMAFAGPDGPAEVFLGLLAWTFIILGIIIIVKFFSLCKNVEKIYTLLSSMNKSGTDTSYQTDNRQPETLSSMNKGGADTSQNNSAPNFW